MIIVRMSGGLGNQMFQYAAARSLSLKTEQPLFFDLRHYAKTREHGYDLAVYSVVGEQITPSKAPPVPRDRPLAALLWRVLGRKPAYKREASLAYDPEIAGIQGAAFIDGYFQSERYFSAYADTIRAELTPKADPDAENARWRDEILAEPGAVSLHVRRGDYVRNAKFAARHGSCTPEYYKKALRHVLERAAGDPVVYAFSDDPDWVRENMKLPVEMRVPGHNDAGRNFEDIRLMSACRHHIVANSSFSWWGAWLNPRQDKIVTAPSRWFADPTIQNPDIWAEGWVRIDG